MERAEQKATGKSGWERVLSHRWSMDKGAKRLGLNTIRTRAEPRHGKAKLPR